jgi:hypothetical protein
MAYRDLIFTNFRRKIFSLLLAILVWMTIHFTENKQKHGAKNNSSTNAPALNP